MKVPDQNHINQVCEALWRRSGGGASVMVGSGFSRNAREVRPPSTPLPMLDEIARELFLILYPDSKPGAKPPPERVLRLAQEFEGTFGPPALHDTLRRLVPDEDHMPGDAHKRLLQLPWAHVFTTNWDTLLERASKAVPDRSYTVVRRATDIPWSTRPRIVKLHGSLPDPPLILTDEGYRRYPFDFAPFVNTVQQAMMETVFLLIGFSGDDPNFLHWSGWIRDNLGDAAPKIYLAGDLKLSRSKRNMLQQSRNVIPIDLAEHPKVDQWPDHLRHKYATSWILSTLECAQPYDISKWPTPRGDSLLRDRDPLLQPIVANASTEPKKEPFAPPDQSSADDTREVVRRTLAIWTHNRQQYPGWVVLPSDEREKQRMSTERWTLPVLQALPAMKALERVRAVHELVWRYEKALARIPSELEAAAEELLSAIDSFNGIDERDRDDDGHQPTTRRACAEIALAILTASRYRLDQSEFTNRLGLLNPFLSDDPEIANRVHYERCLWALWSLDYMSLAECLDGWQADEGDPAWKVRKSALLREIGREDEATLLIQLALEDLRSIPRDGRDLAGLSREGWGLWGVVTRSTLANVREQWNKLAPLHCDPSKEIRDLTATLEGRGTDAAIPRFDLGARPKESPRMLTSRLEEAAYRSIRLTEVGGLPPSNDHISISGHLLKRAAEQLATTDPSLAIRQMLRVVNYDEDNALMRILSRERIAALEKSTARALADDTRAVLRYAISRVDEAGQRRTVLWAESAGVSMEVLSRLVLRIDGSAVEEIFDYALDLYRDPRVASEFWLHQPLRNLLRRSWETLAEEQRSGRILDVLDAPIVATDRSKPGGNWYPDLGEILGVEDVAPERAEDDERRWGTAVARLTSSLGINGLAREHAASRLVAVALWNRLTHEEKARVAKALWELRCGGGGDLPGGTKLFDFAFILLPEPADGLGRRGFGRKWLSGNIAEVGVTTPYGPGSVVSPVRHTNPKKADDILWQVGMAIPFLRRRGYSLALSPEETQYVNDVIEKWTTTNVRRASMISQLLLDMPKHSLRGACHGLSWILSEVGIRQSLAKRLFEMMHELNDADVQAHGLLPSIANAVPELRDDVELMMSTALASDDYSEAGNAMRWLRRWLVWASNGALGFTGPPEHLVREIGRAVAARRHAVLEPALDAVTWVFEEGTEDQREAIRDLVLKGFGYLIEELRYDREQPAAPRLDIPLARWRCAQTARAMAKRGLEDVRVVRKWLEMGRDDPLPEVRHVAHSWYGAAAAGSATEDDLTSRSDWDGGAENGLDVGKPAAREARVGRPKRA